MCIKLGNNELDTVQALMNMSLNAILADVFELDLDDIHTGLSLREDLAMTAAQQQGLRELVDEYFDGLALDFAAINTVDDLFQQVVAVEFELQPAA